MVRDAQAFLKTVVVEEKRRWQSKMEKVRQPRDPLDGCLVREMAERYHTFSFSCGLTQSGIPEGSFGT